MTEVAGNAAGWVYDRTEYLVTITVTLNEAGELDLMRGSVTA